MNKRFYAIQQLERHADLYIFGDIVPFECLPGDVSSAGIVEELKGLDVDVIDVHINSCGGAVQEGWGIYTALLNHPAKIITHGEGFVASAALYPFLAGDERYASTLSAYFFHQVMSGASGYSKDLRAAADELDVLTEIGIQAFVERAGMDADTVRQLMEQETWLTPEQALDMGLATGLEQDAGPAFAQSVRKHVIQKVTAPAAPAGPQTPPPPPQRRSIMQMFKTIEI